MIKAIQIPFYAKASILLIGLLALLTILFVAQAIIVPIIFAVIIAIVLHPLVKFFVKKRIPRIISIAITLLLTFLIAGAISMLIFNQASKFSESWPILVEKFTEILNQTIAEASGYFDINPQKIHNWIDETQSELINASTSVIGKTLVVLGNVIVVLLLIPTYVFIILFYEPLLIEFVHKLFSTDHQSRVTELISLTKTVIQRYLVGLVIEGAIVATMNSAVLFLLGIQYALLLGIIGALLNVIPYIGGLVAVALPMIVALVTLSTPWYALYVLVLYYIIQLIDNNLIVPYIVASKVKINALFSIIAVLVGNALWGIPGMFLSIPLLAIIKLIFDHIDPMKPWGFLLGDTMPPILNMKPILKK